MDLHAVPFPTTHQTEESSFVDKKPAVPPRLHSTPSLPNLLVPHHYNSLPTVLPLQGPARHRPHLRPLDLASSPSSSPTRRDPNAPSRRAPSLLTPPLTPSSSFNSTSNDTPSTPPDSHSPLRWVSSSERERVFSAAHSAYTAGLKSHMSASSATAAHNAGYLTPTSARSQSLSSDDSAGGTSAPAATSDVSSIASGLASVEITPRDERSFVLDGQDDVASDLAIGELSCEKPTRLLLVRNVPRAASGNALLEAFSTMGDVKGVMARFQASHGVIIIAFFDTRHAVRALRQISGVPLPTLDEVRLESAFVSPAQVEKLIGKSDFLSALDGSFLVTVEARAVVPKDVQNMLASFGELAAFVGAGTDPHDQTFHVDYYDCRDAANAYTHLNNRTIFGARLKMFTNKEVLEHPVLLMQGDAPSQDSDSDSQRVAEGRVRPRSVSVSEGVGTPDGVRKVKKVKEIAQDHGRRSSNDLFFDAVGKGFDQSHAASSRPRSISASAEDLAGLVKMHHPPINAYVAAPLFPYSDPSYTPYGHPATVPHMYHHPTHPYPYAVYAPGMGMYPTSEVEGSDWRYASPHPPQVDYYLPPIQRAPAPIYAPPMAVKHVARPTPDIILNGSAHAPAPCYVERRVSGTPPSDGVDVAQNGQRAPGTKNLLDIAAIESGMDTRTTVMIKNIPNKMTDKDLKNFIDRVCPRRIDFMYLRMDFQNGCNVGYAFVNFITVQDLLHFAKTQIGVKWNMYSSEKTLQMCYATYQGKESLVEKFKNSCIMDEKEAWRPKIYHSDGPNQGLPEPFPPPTHLRRKERSQHNRGALFVPGTHHQPSGGGGLYHHRPQPPRMNLR